MRNFVVFVALASGILLGCKQEARQETPSEVNARPGITVRAAQLALPAVQGNPAAAYFTVSNSGSTPAAIAAVALSGVGKTEMHEVKDGKMQAVKTVEVGPGGTVSFAPGGLHVMAFELAPDLAAGQKRELTVTFADGDKVSTPLEIVPPGGQVTTHGASH